MPLRLCVISNNRSELGDQRNMDFSACGGTIGRAGDNDWVLPDANRYVSGRHALIDYQVGAYYLVDTSRNGIYVNNADTPVGRGHPQRLFDGDHLRLGEYDVLVEILEESDDALDDGMRDSVVRAQLVPEDDSMDLQLVDEERLVQDAALARHLIASENSAKVTSLGTLGDRDRATGIGESPLRGEEQAVAIFLSAAGLKPKELAGSVPSEVLQNAGQLLRSLVTGLTELLQERSQLKESFRLSQTIIQSKQNNPLKFSPTVSDALNYLLGDRSESYLSALDAVRASFTEVRNHEQAVPRAMQHALNDFMERFDPDELRVQYDQGLKRNPLLSGTNKLKYWELYEESYQALTQGDDGKLPELFSEDFARAYEHEVEQLKTATRNN
jgi:type VI secretion system protein ImpI